MSANRLLSRLDGVRRTGHGRWLAKCPGQEDRRASFVVRELDDGRVLAHCFAGCEISEALAAVGLEFDALYPEQNPGDCKRERRPFFAVDAFRAVAFEALVVLAAAAALIAGEPITPESRARLVLAVSRIQNALNVAGVAQ